MRCRASRFPRSCALSKSRNQPAEGAGPAVAAPEPASPGEQDPGLGLGCPRGTAELGLRVLLWVPPARSGPHTRWHRLGRRTIRSLASNAKGTHATLALPCPVPPDPGPERPTATSPLSRSQEPGLGHSGRTAQGGAHSLNILSRSLMRRRLNSGNSV